MEFRIIAILGILGAALIAGGSSRIGRIGAARGLDFGH